MTGMILIDNTVLSKFALIGEINFLLDKLNELI